MIGFDEIKSIIIKQHLGNKLHHAILIHGKRGIGKATFAKELALELLTKNSQNKPTHPDLLLIEKQEGKRDIVVDQIRKITEFTNQTSAISQHKFIIVNAAEDLNQSASNSLLKILEEPHQNNFFILISHNPSKLLATIKSRCHLIKISDLSHKDFSLILQKSIFKFSAEEIKIMSIMCDDSPAKAIDIGRDMIEFYELFLNSIKNNIIDDEIIKKVSDKNFNFSVFSEIIIFFLHRLSLYNAGQIDYFIFCEKDVFLALNKKFSIEKIFDLSEEFTKNLTKTNSLNLDKKLLAINLFNKICF